MREEKIESCKTCNACKRVYTKSWYRFWAERHYYCTKHGKIVDGGGNCGNWKKRRNTYNLSEARFVRAEEDVKAIAEYLKDI